MTICLARARQLLANAPGPAPWYLPRNVPACASRWGPLTWAPCRDASVLRDAEGKARLILGMYCYTLALAPRRLLIWHGPRRGSAPAAAHVDFHVIDTDQLDVVTDPEQTTLLLEEHGLPLVAFGSGGTMKSTILSLPAAAPGGTFSIGTPEELEGLPELLFLLHGEVTALWSVRADTQQVEVMPQEWFDRGAFDFGYQWPTRAARDPASGTIVGDGMRIGTFVLDASGRNIAAWLDRSL